MELRLDVAGKNAVALFDTEHFFQVLNNRFHIR